VLVYCLNAEVLNAASDHFLDEQYMLAKVKCNDISMKLNQHC
jgi:hypothetical protein